MNIALPTKKRWSGDLWGGSWPKGKVCERGRGILTFLKSVMERKYRKIQLLLFFSGKRSPQFGGNGDWLTERKALLKVFKGVEKSQRQRKWTY